MTQDNLDLKNINKNKTHLPWEYCDNVDDTSTCCGNAVTMLMILVLAVGML